MNHSEIVEKVNELLTKNNEWEERFADYAAQITKNKTAYIEGAKKFRVNPPLYRYTSVSKVSGKNATFDIRFCGQSVATVHVENEDVKITAKYDNNKKYFGVDIQLDNADWNDPKSSEFRAAFKNLKDGVKVKSPERCDENTLLVEFAKKESINKKLCNIKPVELYDHFFQMPTPLKASNEPIDYAKMGGGIDILARMKRKNKPVDKQSLLCVMELKDENTDKEPPDIVMNQAIAYATFIARLLRSKSGNQWFNLFGFGNDVPKELEIGTVVVMPFCNERNENFENFEEINVAENTFLKLYSLYYQLNEDGSVKEFSGSLVDDTSYPMTLTIHRGTNQIGGCITEISSSRARIIIDMGEELPSEAQKTDIEIEGVTTGEPNCNAVFITHYHGDHVGLYSKILPEIPVYMGKIAKQLYLKLQTRRKDPNIAVIERFKTFRVTYPIKKKDITIRPLRVDHSAFDAYMFLIECDGKKILHTGDFRTHGFGGNLVIPTLTKWVGKVDVLITEGTTLSRPDDTMITEQELQQQAHKLLTDNKYVFAMCSSTNIDRMAAFYNATPYGKYFICDKYQHDLLKFVAQNARSPIYKFEKIHSYGANLLEKMRKRGFCMMVRSGKKFNDIIEQFPDSLFIYSMWEGYLSGEAKIESIAEMVPSGYKYLHTSGHATREAIRKVCETVCPTTIIPIHGKAPRELEKMGLSGEVKILENGERFEV